MQSKRWFAKCLLVGMIRVSPPASRPVALATIEPITQDRIAATGALQADLMHATCPESDQQERLGLSLAIHALVKDAIIEFGWLGVLLVG